MPIQSTVDPFGKDFSHLRSFPDYVLLDIARNGSAQHDYRLLSVEILQGRKSPKINHPDIQDLVRELEIELDGIEFEHPAPSGALTASVTTKTMAEDVEVIDNTKVVFGEPVIEMLEELSKNPLVTENLKADGLVIDKEAIKQLREDLTVPAKPKKTRKPKEPVDAPQPE
jgi:hypothetical protein